MSMLLKYVKVFTLLIASFFIFSVLSSLLPYKYVQKNIEKSIPELLEEGNYPKVILKGDRYRQDNFTDALILNIIASSDSKRPVWSAMVNPYSFQSPDDPNKWYAVKNLDHKVQNMDLSPNILYGRYWHGSAAACKFLLLIMDYQQLKWFLYIVSTLLLLLFAVRIVNKVGWIKSLPLFLALLFANFFVIQFAIQFFPVMAIALAGGIWMCKNGHKSQKKITMCLLIIGMLTAYFDLLTTPLLTLGIPLIVYMILQGEEKKSAYDFFKSIFILCLAWLIGYAGAWATKWILINIFTDATAIYAIDAIKWNAKAKDYTRWDAIVRNFNLIPLVWLNIILTFLLLLTFFSFNKKGISFAIAFLIVGLFPYIWYFVLSGHSYTHWWFTYRAQMISMSCIMLFFVFLIDWERIKLKMRIKNWKSKIKNHYKIKNTVKIILRIINKMVNILKPFLIVALLFIISGIIFNTVETFIFYKYQDFIPFSTIIQSYFNIIAVFCLYSLILLPFYLFITLLNQKTAQILISILFALLISLEIGLYVYYTQAGVLMGRELVIRPLSETLVTIRNSSNIIINSILIVIVLACFIALPFVLKKVKIFNHYRSSIVTVIIIGILSACTLFYQRDGNQIVNNYLESKSFFFFSALKNHSIDETGSDYFLFDEEGNFEKIEKNEEILRKYVALYNKTAEDLDYPMECFSSEIPDVLSPYFKKSEKQPNIVIIMVESLGNPLLGEKGENISFTPYLDYLANNGLYWKNCLSTTTRTYGVLPSVTGSLPHGMKGFQFGIMPKHHSLFSILKNNNYATNFFYGGDANFDSMLNYLTAQDIDHIDDFMPQIRTYKKNKQANWWGLHDGVLFDKSLEYLKTLPNEKPKLNVYLTITTHDPFNSREDKKLKDFYEAKTEKIFSKLDEKQQNYFLPIKDRIAGFIYIDDCIKNFIHNYSKRPDFENTIFIITGDHSIGDHERNLPYHSVPLIIWSPLLKTHKAFPNIVSHLAIAPSIISLLHNNYNVAVPEKLSWCSTGLDTASVFNPSEKVLFLSYDRRVNKMVYNRYFFEDKTQWHDKRLFEINENLDLEPMDDPRLMEQIHSKFKTLKYVNNYVYHNNKLVKADNNLGNDYVLIKGYENKDVVVVKTPDTIPSISGLDIFEIMPIQKINNQYNKIKIRLKADVILNDFLWQDKHMMLHIICSGKNFDYASKDIITKYILDDELLCNRKYELSIEKEIDVRDLEESFVHIYVTPNEYDGNWEPDKKITISNIKVLIWGK